MAYVIYLLLFFVTSDQITQQILCLFKFNNKNRKAEKYVQSYNKDTRTTFNDVVLMNNENLMDILYWIYFTSFSNVSIV